MKNSKFKIRNFAVLFCIFHFAFFISSCSVPVLEPAECSAARQTVREFYSFHFGNEMNFSAENLRQREKFLSPQFVESLKNLQTDADVFTTGDTDYPKAFRAGECRLTAPDRTEIKVLLFWKDDVRSEQREIKVEAVRQNDKWLIDKIIQK
jgi:hypothetical protein